MLDVEGRRAKPRDRPTTGRVAVRSGPDHPELLGPDDPVLLGPDDPVAGSGPSRSPADGRADQQVRGRPGVHRSVAPSLSGRRLLLAASLLLVIPVVLAVAAIRYQPPEPPPVVTAPGLAVLPQVPDAVLDAQLDRGRRVFAMTAKLAAPTLLAPFESGALPTLALTPRAAAYSLPELRQLVPAAFAADPGPASTGGAVLLMANLQVPFGATLVIDGRTPEVRLVSSPGGFATILSRGTITVAGAGDRPVRITSWNPTLGRPDDDSSDGRSFIDQIGGRMDVAHAVFQYLGFNLGVSSGVAWSGAAPGAGQPTPVKAGGTVTSSLFLHNYFGAYTKDADGMHWVGNAFADNEQYGFDPHDFSNNFVVEGNIAYRNGKHGFIFSRGCTNNILRGNVAYHNTGHGFMIDDGRTRPTPTAQMRVNGSNDNQVIDNVSYGNGGNGIEIEGGTGTIVTGNHLAQNLAGIQFKDDASGAVRDNMIIDNVKYGVDVRNAGGRLLVSGNTITGSWGAVNLATAASATVGDNVIADSAAPLVVAGTPIRERSLVEQVIKFLHFNPLVLLWTVVLGVPLGMVVVRLVLRASRIRRRRIPVA